MSGTNDAIWRRLSEAEQAAALAQTLTAVQAAGGFRLDDTGNAERFVARYGPDVRYDHTDGRWLVWTETEAGGGYWRPDTDGAAQRLAKETARGIYGEADLAAKTGRDEQAAAIARWAGRSAAEARRNAMLNLARSEHAIAVTRDQLDRHPLLLNVQNGTLDLATGTLREARRADLMTSLLSVRYDPDATCPVFDRFLSRVQPSADMRAYLATAAGLALSGQVLNRPVLLFYGTGANGKTTMIETLLTLLGPLGHKTRAEVLMARRRGSAPDEVAALAGKRLVVASELSDGRLDEALVKDLTGGDAISARHLYGRPFTFSPGFSLFLYGNRRPTITGTDDGIWRRVQLVPFGVQIPPAERDPDLPAKLREELPGILAWAVRGWSAWRRNGFTPPAAVQAATADYREESDTLGQFLAERCLLGADKSVRAGDLYDEYAKWATAGNLPVLSSVRFSRAMAERGMGKQRHASGHVVYAGVGVLA